MLEVMKLDEIKCQSLGHFVHYKGWIGPRTAWANEVIFLWNLPQGSIDPTTFVCSVFFYLSALLFDKVGNATFIISLTTLSILLNILSLHITPTNENKNKEMA